MENAKQTISPKPKAHKNLSRGLIYSKQNEPTKNINDEELSLSEWDSEGGRHEEFTAVQKPGSFSKKQKELRFKKATDPNRSFVRSLCIGRIDEEIVFPYPKVSLKEAPLLVNVIELIDTFFKDKKKELARWDQEGLIPEQVLNQLKEIGLFGLLIPEKYGGLGLTTSAYSRSLQQLSYHDASVAIMIGAHLSIGIKGLLLYGTHAQKKKFLPKASEGEIIASFCLTEAGSGSDAASVKTNAIKKGDSWILNGEKIWVTNGGIANLFTVFAKTNSENGKISAFLVTRDMPGVSTGRPENKMGIRASSTTTVRFDNVYLSAEHLLGPEGLGFKIAMNILNSGRTGLGGGCVGAMKHLIELASQQAKTREQFGKTIASFGLVKKKIGQMVVDCYASESVVNMVSGLIDKGVKNYAVEAAISKVFSTEALFETADQALQIAGGNGYMKGFPYEQILRDSRVNRIFEGTNEILSLYIALTGMSYASELLEDVGKIVGSPKKVFSDPIKGFGIMFKYSKRWTSHQIGYGAETLNLVSPIFLEEKKDFEIICRYIGSLTDKLLKRHKTKIVEKQIISERMAHILMDTFVTICVLSRVTASITKNGPKEAEFEIDVAKTFCFQSKKRIESNMMFIEENCDERLKKISDNTVQNGKYCWDYLVA